MKLPYEKISRNILLKEEFETDLKYGEYPEKRRIKDLIQYGIVNINKPSGPTNKGHITSGF